MLSAAPAMVDFPTPPFAEDTATTLSTFEIRRFGGRPRLGIRGGDGREGRPWWEISNCRSNSCSALPMDFHVEVDERQKKIAGSLLYGSISRAES